MVLKLSKISSGELSQYISNEILRKFRAGTLASNLSKQLQSVGCCAAKFIELKFCVLNP